MAEKKKGLPTLKEAFAKQDAMDSNDHDEDDSGDKPSKKKGPGPQPFPPFKKGKK